ncbi:MAG: hypothetical protein HC936_00245 [Leptolyngbyaceae cyanobacterium SU_3_3]|nr:hypothetical protein [Leptolyngbyaceae cyanobacterium SU_3_3]NJR51174.1 hypothetical protein [Leptolyngbyaceae cyanobacterium CSU_1_3]
MTYSPPDRLHRQFDLTSTMRPTADTNTDFVVSLSRLGLPVSESFPEPPVGGQTFVNFSVLRGSCECIKPWLVASLSPLLFRAALGTRLWGGSSTRAPLHPQPSLAAMVGALRRSW